MDLLLIDSLLADAPSADAATAVAVTSMTASARPQCVRIVNPPMIAGRALRAALRIAEADRSRPRSSLT
jgi:hypothetical protein